MKDYVQLPPIIETFDEIEEGCLKRFLRGCKKINSNQISLECLRDLYLKDKKEFFQIVDELALRGFYFFTEKPNNILPSGKVSFDKYILSAKDLGRYKILDFQKLGLSGFIQRFNIGSDTFFHKIPLDGFRRINSNLDMKLLEKELVKAGFTIANVIYGEIIENKQDSKEVLGQNGKGINSTGTSLDSQNSVHNELTLSNEHYNLWENSIEKVFAENMYRTFREFCKINNIQTIEEIKDRHFEEYGKLRGVGVGKVEAVKKRVIFFREHNAEHLEVRNILQSNENELELIQQVPQYIDEVFPEGKFRTFRDFCKKNKINTISELTNKHYLDYSSIKGVGVGKVEAVKQRVTEYLTLKGKSLASEVREQNIPSDNPKKSIFIEELFTENIFRDFRKYCNNNHIRTIYEITSKDLEKIGEMRGVGAGKIEAIKQRINAFIEKNTEPLPITVSAASIEINTMFMENKYNLFKKFCTEQGINTVGQLQTHHLEMFRSLKGVGKRRFEEVKEILSHYIESADSKPKFFESGQIFEVIKEMTVYEVLRFYGYPTSSRSKLKIRDIEGKDIAELGNEIELHLLFDLSNRLKKEEHPKEIASKIKTMVSERDFAILKHRFEYEETLEEVGSHFGVTRERIRQIIKVLVKKILGYLRRKQFSTIIRLMAKSNSFVTRRELIDFVGAENEFLINLLKQEDLLFKYYKKLDIFFFDENGKMDFRVIEEFIGDLPEIFNFYEYQQSLEEVLESIGIEEPSLEIIQNLIEAGGYIKYGEFYSRHKLTINEVLTCLFKHYIDEPLRIDEEGVTHLQALAKRHLDYELGNTIRAIDARIRDAESVLLVDRSTFQYFDSENFDTTIISEIEAYLNEEFNKRDVINVQDVFQKFRGRLEQLGIHNKLHLYSLVRYYLDEKFTIGQGNTLNIFRNEKSKLSVDERLVAFMKRHGGLCSKDQLLEVIKPQYKLDLAISSSDQIIAWGNNYAILVENLNFQPAEKALLIEYFNQVFQKGYSTASYMFKEMMFDRKLSTILRNKGIDEANKLAAIIKLFLPNVKGHTNYLYVEGHDFDSFEKVIAAHFTDETSRQEIKEFAFEYGYKEMMAANFLKKLLEQGVFVEIDVDLLYPAKKLKISETSLAEIKAYAEEEMGSQQYLSLSNLKGYRRKLPSIGFRWNAYLLKSVLQRCGFRQVKKTFNDYRYDKIIVVKDESYIQTFEDLVVYLLENEYDGNMHELAIYDFLMEKGIVREQEYMHKKTLPYEIRSSEKFHFDELGYVTIRQGK